ncbi:MAG: RagB/SusD family nutrient uptake outer membrane protein [Dysgonamonadaceae bacterium]|jgi:hypothetical protein|nr:RagB/SusD family nutrient uptake outer membrane protein [Dysgonamonadaceae bacterium]
MKNKFYLLLLMASLIGISVSCSDNDFLDETATTDLTTEVIFSDSTYTTGFLTEIYREIGFDTDPGRFSERGIVTVRHGGLQTACDEAEFQATSKITTDMLFATGSVNSVVVDEDTWNKPYENIRRVNVFLENVDSSPLSESKRTVFKAEARFLRAWYYFILVKHYGGVPLIGDVVYKNGDEIKTERNTFEECINYILTECDTAARDLPLKPLGRDYGRVGIGSCKGLKSRVLLYAASPLFNGGAEAPEGFPKELIAYPAYDKNRWRLAKQAAEEVITLNTYSLFVDHEAFGDYLTYYQGSFPDASLYGRGEGFFWTFQSTDNNGTIDGPAAREMIVEQQVQKSQYRESLFNPPSRGGSGGGFVYQDLVDAFPMVNGKAISDPTSGYDEQNPYLYRDPRLFYSICYDQHYLMNAGTVTRVNTYLKEDGTPYDQDGVYSGTPTGYYICKTQHFFAAAANYFIAPPQSRPQIRYAEILLNYAEAANEWEGPTPEIYEALKAIRERAGIFEGDDGLYGLKADMTQDEMREAIRTERRIELAFEGHRFFDVRRWMIAPETESKMMTGMEIRLTGGQKRYSRFNVRQHVWRPAMYYWPIPNKEISKSTDLIQNPYY